MRLMHVALIAGYIQLVAADLCCRAVALVRLAALRLPTNLCLRTFNPRPDPPPPPVLAELSPLSLGSLCMRAQVPLVNTRGAGSADNVCLGSSALVQPLLPVSVLAPVSCDCASALRASSVLSSDDEIWLCDETPPVISSCLHSCLLRPSGAEADGALWRGSRFECFFLSDSKKKKQNSGTQPYSCRASASCTPERAEIGWGCGAGGGDEAGVALATGSQRADGRSSRSHASSSES